LENLIVYKERRKMIDWTQLRDCLHISEFTAKELKKMFLVYGGSYDVSHIEMGCPPHRWIKIVFGRKIPEISESEVHSCKEKVN